MSVSTPPPGSTRSASIREFVPGLAVVGPYRPEWHTPEEAP
ncbi:MAG TPA: hypothetical protein PLO87_07540 [Ornithinibacter sp.]|jgi:hypothetical protein|nr:hypothetical protein [Ornithinibacter sp.]HQA14551.1 hypothetical protein [Ornithinibacter sp.]HQD68430.1 hypothetical protein [Ornithinibacter sp.]